MSSPWWMYYDVLRAVESESRLMPRRLDNTKKTLCRRGLRSEWIGRMWSSVLNVKCGVRGWKCSCSWRLDSALLRGFSVCEVRERCVVALS